MEQFLLILCLTSVQVSINVAPLNWEGTDPAMDPSSANSTPI